MRNSARRLTGAIAKAPSKSPTTSGQANASRLYAGLFNGTESVDANLSQVIIGGTTFRYVPRLSSTWTAAPALGTPLLVASVNGSLIILGIQVGDTTKAAA